MNLVDNSLRHGGAVSRISIAAEEQEEGLLVVFEDDGVGIAPDEKELIFERGYGKNTGFGLFIQEILGITHIRIKETGTAGQGVRFEMSVPKGMYKKMNPVSQGWGHDRYLGYPSHTACPPDCSSQPRSLPWE